MDIINKMKAKLADKASLQTNPQIQINDFTVDFQSLCVTGNVVQGVVDMQISVFAYPVHENTLLDRKKILIVKIYWKLVHKRLTDAIALIIRYISLVFS